jgi:hypothetical protein
MNWITRFNAFMQRTWFLPRARKRLRNDLRIPNKPSHGFIDSTKRNSTRAVP